MDVFKIAEKVTDLRQTQEYAQYMQRRGWVVEKAHEFVYLKKLPFLPFWVMKCQRWVGEMNWDKLDEIKRKYWVILTILEPNVTTFDLLKGIPPLHSVSVGMTERGYRLINESYLPTKTLVVDLRQTKEKLWKELKKDARQTISKQLSVDSLQIKQITDLEKFRNEWKKTKKGYLPSIADLQAMKEAFGEKMWMLGVEKGGIIIAGAIVLVTKDCAYYYFAWTNEEGRELGAQYKLVWEAMMRAKKKRIKFWDFEGIEDARFPRKSWKGFSLFKKKFGGQEVSFPGCYQRWF